MSSDTKTNPYAPPTAAAVSDRLNMADYSIDDGNDVDGVDFVPILYRWEQMRVFYNGILVLIVMLLTFGIFPNKASDLSYWLSIVLGGVIANVCFLTGPAIEGYCRHFGLWNAAYTTLLFLGGLGLTVLLAIACIALY